jgi:hypothetical protein
MKQAIVCIIDIKSRRNLAIAQRPARFHNYSLHDSRSIPESVKKLTENILN